eukprot:TRINITY_DN821_c0_g1_i1.p2 TRINITY_DN821_c0_g1~~TRINITY_DN821_c0_g1_i1.p2  ORF type:complete len:457 (+),score=97.29 TRINITY_DN821_c0_g1_i1:457-1827(+)
MSGHKKDRNKNRILKIIESGKIDALNQFIAKSPASVNKKGSGISPLHKAVDNPEILQILLNNEANVNVIDKNNETVLHHAVKTDNVDTVLALLGSNSLDLSIVDKKGRSVLHIAVMNDAQESMEKILAVRSEDRYHPDNCGYDFINIIDNSGISMLNLSIIFEKMEILENLLENYSDVIDLDIVDAKGRTALHRAVKDGMVEIAKSLIDKGCNPETLDNSNNSPLHIASERGHIGIVSYLIANSTEYDIPNNDGYTPLHLAVFNGNEEIARILQNNGCDVSIRYNSKSEGDSSRENSFFRLDSSREFSRSKPRLIKQDILVDHNGYIRESHEQKEMKKAIKQSIKKYKLDTKKGARWKKLIRNWDFYVNSKPESIRKAIYKGIPNAIRGDVYMRITTSSVREDFDEESYKELLEVEVDPKVLNLIDMDIKRSARNHVLFEERFGPGYYPYVLNINI